MDTPGPSTRIDDLPIDIIAESVPETPTTTASMSEIIEKYKSGEVSFDNYELMFDEESPPAEPPIKQPRPTLDIKEDKPRKTYDRTRKIPPHIKALIGEANIRYARGDLETALKMCFEVIRQHPTAPEPYLSLAQIYEAKNDRTNCMKHTFYAATCSPKDVDLWVRLAELHLECGNKKEAVTAYSSAINANPKDIKLHLKRIEILENVGDERYLRRAYVRLMSYLTDEESELLNMTAIKVAREYHKLNDYHKAIDALNVCFNKPNHTVTLEVINIMLELLLIIKNYSMCLDIFVAHCNIDVELLVEDKGIHIVSYTMPDDINIDLKIKFVVCAIKLNSVHLFEQMLHPLLLMEDQIESIGDLFLDVAETLMAEGQPEEALKFLVPLIKSRNFSLPGVWLKYSDCLKDCEMYEQAVDNYRQVVRMAPLHTEVRYSLASVLIKLDRKEEALAALEQDPTQPTDVGLLVQRINLLKDMKRYADHLESMKLLLSRHCVHLKYYEELIEVTFFERYVEKLNRIKRQRFMRGETYEEGAMFVCEKEPSIQDEYAMFRDSLQLTKDHKDYATMQLLVFTALSSSRFKEKRKELNLLAFIACILNKDATHAYRMIREIITYERNRIVWNFFNMLLQFAEELNHTMFLVESLSPKSERMYLEQIKVNYFLLEGKNSLSINECLQIVAKHPDPLKCLVVGCYIMHLLQNNLISDRSAANKFLFGLFMQYAQTRSAVAVEEVNYNLGRFFQAAGILHVAEHYYNLVLDGEREARVAYLSVKREAAFNLHLIYKKSKNFKMARYVLFKYIEI